MICLKNKKRCSRKSERDRCNQETAPQRRPSIHFRFILFLIFEKVVESFQSSVQLWYKQLKIQKKTRNLYLCNI